MNFPWAILISLIVVIGAFIIKAYIWNSLDEDTDAIKLTVAGFFVVYALAATAIYFLNPKIGSGSVELGSIVRVFTIEDSGL